jgi:hypothetical protein
MVVAAVYNKKISRPNTTTQHLIVNIKGKDISNKTIKITNATGIVYDEAKW